MILYNVTTKILPDVHEEWLQWMQTVHVVDVMNTGCFQSYRLSRLDKQDEQEEEFTYVFQYTAATREDLERYVNDFAPALRDDVLKKYKDKFIAFRTVMELVSEG